MTARVCTVEACERKYQARGFCQPHYWRAVRNAGDPLAHIPIRKNAPAGSGHVDSQGYRRHWLNGSPKSEHRLVMEQVLCRDLTPWETKPCTTRTDSGRTIDQRTSNSGQLPRCQGNAPKTLPSGSSRTIRHS